LTSMTCRRAGFVRVLGAAWLATCACSGLALAHGVQQDDRAGSNTETVLDEVVVHGRAMNLERQTSSASQGVIGAIDLARRPLSRPGELLEVVPGAAVTQHSGSGKANQYFLRGFNLDHGTDFTAAVAGMPLNQPTHGHGQGYLDLNPIIPELVASIAYGKGPYHAEIGDFGSAGYARYRLKSSLQAPVVSFTAGEFGFYRGVAAGGTTLHTGDLLGAVEVQSYDGPWELSEQASKVNALLRYSDTTSRWHPQLTLMAYDAEWNATDQVPQRAIEQGRISRLGNIDPTLGGASSRYALAIGFDEGGDEGWRGHAYLVRSSFELYSNFTYFLDDPVDGDQITQVDRRITAGGDLTYRRARELPLGTLDVEAGVAVRHDRIGDLGLFRSAARTRLATVREDEVRQTSVGGHVSGRWQPTPAWRLVVGARIDTFRFDVSALSPQPLAAINSGRTSDTIVTPKASLIYGPGTGFEWFANFGQGFHSNDARGTTTFVDPASGDAVEPVDPLVRTTGAETGVRVNWGPGRNSTLAVWALTSASELVFVGDAGTTEASDASRRYGIEWTNYVALNDWLTLDFDLALSEARFRDVVDDHVPQAVGRVVSAGLVADHPRGWFGALRVRHFGDSPLVETGAVKAEPTTVVNARGGYRLTRAIELTLDVFNLLDSEDPDISYYFASRLPGEGTAIEDVHVHPVEPRAFRATLRYRFR